MDLEIYTMYIQTIYIQTIFMLKHGLDLTHSLTAVKVHKLGQIQQKISNEFMVLGLGKTQAWTN